MWFYSYIIPMGFKMDEQELLDRCRDVIERLVAAFEMEQGPPCSLFYHRGDESYGELGGEAAEVIYELPELLELLEELDA